MNNIKRNSTKVEFEYLLLMGTLAIGLKHVLIAFSITGEGIAMIGLVLSIVLTIASMSRLKIGSKLYILISFSLYFIAYWKEGGATLLCVVLLSWVILVCLHGKSNVFFN